MVATPTSLGRIRWIAATLITPYVLLSVLVVVCEPLNLPGEYDWVLLAMAVLAGCVVCWKAAYGLHWALRAAFIAILAPILSWTLFFWLLTFSGLVYGHWL